MNKQFKQARIESTNDPRQTRQQIDRFLADFKGQNKIQRAASWDLKGAGENSSSFLQSVSSVGYSIIPNVNNAYSLGSGVYKWADIKTRLINGVLPRSGTVTVYVASSSGGSPTTSLTFDTGILT